MPVLLLDFIRLSVGSITPRNIANSQNVAKMKRSACKMLVSCALLPACHVYSAWVYVASSGPGFYRSSAFCVIASISCLGLMQWERPPKPTKTSKSAVIAKKGKMRLVQKRVAVMKSKLWKKSATFGKRMQCLLVDNARNRSSGSELSLNFLKPRIMGSSGS